MPGAADECTNTSFGARYVVQTKDEIFLLAANAC